MAERFANNSQTSLNGAINVSQTTFNVLDGSKLPLQPQFRIRVDDELMLVTGVSGNTLTVTRGIESTIATSHNNQRVVRHVLTAGAIDSMAQKNSIVASKVWRQASDGSVPVGTYGPTTFDALVGAVVGSSDGTANSTAIETIFAADILDVLFPPVDLYFARPIVPPAGCTLRGASLTATRLLATSAIGTGALLDVYNAYVHISHMTLVGSAAAGCTVLWMGNPAHDPNIAVFDHVEDVNIVGASTACGIREDNAVANTFARVNVYGCVDGACIGKNPTQSGCPTTGHYATCIFNTCGYGVHYYSGSSYSFESRCLAENCGVAGFSAPISINCGGLTIEDFWFEGNANPQLDIDGTVGLANLTIKRIYANVTAGLIAVRLNHVNILRVEGGALGSGDGVLLITGGASDGFIDPSFHGVVVNDSALRHNVVTPSVALTYPYKGTNLIYYDADNTRIESNHLVMPAREGVGKLVASGTATAIDTTHYGCGDAVVSVPSAEYLLDSTSSLTSLQGTHTPFMCAFQLQVDSVAGTKDWFSVSNAALDRVALAAFTDGANLQTFRYDGVAITYVTAALPSANVMLTYVYCLHNDGKLYLVSAAGTSSGVPDTTGNLTGLTGVYLSARGTASHTPPNILWRRFSVRLPSVAANCLSEAQRLYSRLIIIP